MLRCGQLSSWSLALSAPLSASWPSIRFEEVQDREALDADYVLVM